jgi:hypothetical protein
MKTRNRISIFNRKCRVCGNPQYKELSGWCHPHYYQYKALLKKKKPQTKQERDDLLAYYLEFGYAELKPTLFNFNKDHISVQLKSECKYLVKKIRLNNFNFTLSDMNKIIELYQQSQGVSIDTKPFDVQMKIMFNRLEIISGLEKSEFSDLHH